ncbi:MAG TPA: hypothetical protein VLT88_14575, partial [Desulfosarcina sp.]|nr:hypothetical protein [Desulfosarcina sp.]
MNLSVRWIAAALSIIVLVGMVPASLPAARSPAIPAALEPWREWVLHDVRDSDCPAHFDDAAQRRCAWPTHLSVVAGEHGALFDLRVAVYASAWVTLPGDDAHWPESVASGSDALAVVSRGARPAVWLAPGEHRLKGAFVCEHLPEMLQIPPATGIVSLLVDGREIADPEIDAAGRLRLYGRGAAGRLEDSLAAAVFRLVEDDIP